MAVTAKMYGIFLKNQLSGASVVDWDTDTIRCSLHTATYVPDQDAHDFFSDVTNEITGTGYTAEGVALTTSAPSYDTATNEVRLDATDAQWTTASFTARIAVVYKDTGSAATSPLIGYIDFGADTTVSSGTFTIQWDSTGVAKVTVS
jgi:hypothetical protein